MAKLEWERGGRRLRTSTGCIGSGARSSKEIQHVDRTLPYFEATCVTPQTVSPSRQY